jgi:hypothetical protein
MNQIVGHGIRMIARLKQIAALLVERCLRLIHKLNDSEQLNSVARFCETAGKLLIVITALSS